MVMGDAREAVILSPMFLIISSLVDVWSMGTIVSAIKLPTIIEKKMKNIHIAIVASADAAIRERRMEKSIAIPSQNAPYSRDVPKNNSKRKDSPEAGDTPINLKPRPDTIKIMLPMAMAITDMPAKNFQLKT